MTSRVWGVRERPRYDLSEGLCVGHKEPDIWFDISREGEARAICHNCPARAICTLAAYEFTEQFGVWGGTDPWERGTPPTFSG